MKWKPISVESDLRGRIYTYVVDDATHKELFWLTRYESIHRLLTHCTNRPKMFKTRGIQIHVSENI